jgi:asparagine synthase (glutamine-hydrolysing)
VFGSYAVAIGRGQHRHALGECAASLGLPVRIETHELLLVGTERAMCLSGDDAILLGQAFDETGERLTALPVQFATLDQPSGRGAALHRVWGNYAFFSASAEQAFVYREPSGSVPVYRCGGENQTIFLSDAEIGLQLGVLRQPEIDATFLVHWLQYPFLRTRRSGLRNASELLPGMFSSRTGSGRWIEAPAWHPAMFATRRRAIDDPSEAADRLRETALSVVPAQISGTDIVLRLSGGLDSSIIAACLSKAEVQFSCINFATRARDGDEREHAREVAGAFGLELVEVGEPEQVGLEVPARKSFRPLINPLLEPFERAVARTADQLGARTLIDGGGGDNLFCSITSAAPVIDALAAGILRNSAAAVTDIAARADCTIWDVLAAVGRRLLRRRRSWKEDRSFLRPKILLGSCEPHPWLRNLAAPPGKREHVEALVHIHHFLDRSA